MKKYASLFIACGALMLSAVPSYASQVSPNIILAQVDVQVGPGGVRIGGERDRDRFEDRRREDRFDERRRDDRFEERRERRVIVEPREQRCRTVIERRETPYGIRTQRIQRCG